MLGVGFPVGGGDPDIRVEGVPGGKAFFLQVGCLVVGFPAKCGRLRFEGLCGLNVVVADLEGKVVGMNDGECFVVDGVESVEAALEGETGFVCDGAVGFVLDGATDFDTGQVNDEYFFSRIARGGCAPGGVH
ncbi:MAG: hypothetical protein CMF28_00855 [Kiritimatiellaceae bacterium]|nr:hypothetical protein [Kiritimatiellaceae bacterium]